MHRALLAVSILASLPTLAAQQVWLVQGGGPAFARTLAQARHGDTLLVRAGTYDSVPLDKGVRVLCDAGVVFQNLTFLPGLFASRLPAGTQLLVRGATITGVVHAGYDFGAFSCAGHVVFDGCDVQTSDGKIDRCGSVLFRGCSIRRLIVESSVVGFADCTIGSGFAEPSLYAVGSEVAISGGTVRGNDLLVPTPAITLDGGAMTIAGDAATRIVGGQGSQPTPAIDHLGGLLRLHPAVTLTANQVPPIRGPGAVERAPFPSVALSRALSGQGFDVAIHAEPGGVAAAFLSWSVTPIVLPPLGALWVDPLSPVLLTGTVPPDGWLRASTIVPVLPLAVPVVVQPLSATASHGLLLGAPSALVIN